MPQWQAEQKEPGEGGEVPAESAHSGWRLLQETTGCVPFCALTPSPSASGEKSVCKTGDGV